MFGNLLKISGHDQKCSQWFTGVEKFRSWFLRSPQKDPSKLLRAGNDGKVEWNTTHRILPVAILAFDWLHFSSRHGIKYNTIHCNTIPCNTICTLQYNTIAMQCNTISDYNTTQLRAKEYNTKTYSCKYNDPQYLGIWYPGAPLTYFNDWGGSKCLFGPPESNIFLFFAGAVTLIFKPFRIV